MGSKAGYRPIHFVGSFPLDSADDVFAEVHAHCGTLPCRLSDGETGDRALWIVFQRDRLMQLPTLVSRGTYRLGETLDYPLLAPAVGLSAQEVDFGSLGYADAAHASYNRFLEARHAGLVAPATRFQVSLPTPMAIIFCFFDASVRREVWPHYAEAMRREVAKILEIVPSNDLAIQWDAPAEIVGILANPANAADWSLEELATGVATMIDSVEAPAEAGLHLCYGDVDGKHVIEPDDTGLMTRFANAVVAQISRPLNWLHMPVPIGRTDEAYFRPLAGLTLPAETELYLGLLHGADGVDGAQARMQAARPFISKFGIATECGLGRRPREELSDILDLHRKVAAVPQEG